MRSIATYIEYTLMTSHYAFVPGLGGFLFRDIDASYSHKTYTPSHKEIHYNRFLTKDDGMLANAYMIGEGISYDEAIAKIRFEVNLIKSSLDSKKSYQLGSLGVLSYDSDKHIVVKQAKHFPLDPETFGFNSIQFKTWREIQQETAKQFNESNDQQKAEIIEIPKIWAQRVAAIVIIALLYVANISYFAGQSDSLVDYASVIDSDVLFGNIAPNNLSYQSWDENWEKEIILSDIETSVIPNSEIEQIKEVSTDVELDKVEKTLVSDRIYYIIIASCTSRTEAERVVAKKETEGFSNVGILEKDGRFRLYLKSFTDRTEGETYLEQVRVSTPFQKAWLLPVKQESLLSYYLKNFDNDQLPMELSHPHQRTERDQGWINT